MPSTVSVYAGVDLAADPKRTGLATIRDEGERVVVEDARLGAGDDAIISLSAGRAKLASTCPSAGRVPSSSMSRRIRPGHSAPRPTRGLRGAVR